MNIFALDTDPQVAASYHCDKHVVKMILESSQMLCTILHDKGIEAPYKPTHRNHPCTKWAAESRENFVWLLQLGFWLCVEYRSRYGKNHKSEEVIRFCHKHIDLIPESPFTPFAQAMPDEFRNEDPVTAYRNYYRIAKAPILTYKFTPTPTFLQ